MLACPARSASACAVGLWSNTDPAPSTTPRRRQDLALSTRVRGRAQTAAAAGAEPQRQESSKRGTRGRESERFWGRGERGPACSPPLSGCAKGPLQRRPSWSAVSVFYGLAVCRFLPAPRARPPPRASRRPPTRHITPFSGPFRSPTLSPLSFLATIIVAPTTTIDSIDIT